MVIYDEGVRWLFICGFSSSSVDEPIRTRLEALDLLVHHRNLTTVAKVVASSFSVDDGLLNRFLKTIVTGGLRRGHGMFINQRWFTDVGDFLIRFVDQKRRLE